MDDHQSGAPSSQSRAASEMVLTVLLVVFGGSSYGLPDSSLVAIYFVVFGGVPACSSLNRQGLLSEAISRMHCPPSYLSVDSPIMRSSLQPRRSPCGSTHHQHVGSCITTEGIYTALRPYYSLMELTTVGLVSACSYMGIEVAKSKGHYQGFILAELVRSTQTT